MAHAKLSPSASTRWLNCPGSVALIDTLPKSATNRTSAAAAEGTQAHELAEQCLMTGTSPGEYHESLDMTEAVAVYIDYVYSNLMANTELQIEKKCSLKYLKVPGLDGGTSDAILINRKAGTIEVIDYKHGKGIVVEADNNTQMMQYALGALELAGTLDFKEVKMTIVQPRASHPDGPIRSYTMPVQELLDWCEYTLVPIATSTMYYDAPLTPGEAQCRWCDAAGLCPALHERTQEIAQIEFTDLTESSQLPSPSALTPEQIANVLEHSSMIRTFLDGVQAHATYLVDNGTSLPGFKLVRAVTRRKLKPNAHEYLFTLLEQDEIYDEKVLAMSKIEKALKLHYPNEYKTLIGDLTIKPIGSTVLAKEGDKRVEVEPSVTSDFEGM